jgi:hypothetical protein
MIGCHHGENDASAGELVRRKNSTKDACSLVDRLILKGASVAAGDGMSGLITGSQGSRSMGFYASGEEA